METKPSPFSNEKEFIKYYINKYDEYGPISDAIAMAIGSSIVYFNMDYGKVIEELEEYLKQFEEISEQDKDEFLLIVEEYYLK